MLTVRSKRSEENRPVPAAVTMATCDSAVNDDVSEIYEDDYEDTDDDGDDDDDDDDDDYMKPPGILGLCCQAY